MNVVVKHGWFQIDEMVWRAAAKAGSINGKGYSILIALCIFTKYFAKAVEYYVINLRVSILVRNLLLLHPKKHNFKECTKFTSTSGASTIDEIEMRK